MFTRWPGARKVMSYGKCGKTRWVRVAPAVHLHVFAPNSRCASTEMSITGRCVLQGTQLVKVNPNKSDVKDLKGNAPAILEPERGIQSAAERANLQSSLCVVNPVAVQY